MSNAPTLDQLRGHLEHRLEGAKLRLGSALVASARPEGDSPQQN